MQARTKLGLSLEELAVKMGKQRVRLSVQQIAAIEKGERKTIDYEVLAIAKALKVTTNWLVMGRG